MPVTPTLGRSKNRWILGAHWSARLTETTNSRFSQRRDQGRDPNDHLWFPCMPILAYIHIHTHVCIHTPHMHTKHMYTHHICMPTTNTHTWTCTYHTHKHTTHKCTHTHIHTHARIMHTICAHQTHKYTTRTCTHMHIIQKYTHTHHKETHNLKMTKLWDWVCKHLFVSQERSLLIYFCSWENIWLQQPNKCIQKNKRLFENTGHTSRRVTSPLKPGPTAVPSCSLRCLQGLCSVGWRIRFYE